MKAGRAKTTNPTRVAVAAWSYVHGLLVLYFGGQLPLDTRPEQLLEMAKEIDLFLRP